MQIVFSLNGVPIRLTDERWEHIIRRHPEISRYKDKVLEAITQPDIIQQGEVGTLLAIKKQKDKYVVVIYKEISKKDGFIITAYFSERLRRRLILWRH